MGFKEYPVILVEWIDAIAEIGWVGIDEIKPEKSICKTIGFLIKENENELVLTNSLTQTEDQFSGYFSIPQGCIKEKWIINYNEK